MARDSGNNAQDPPVIMASKTPADSPSLPNYHGHNHVHHESASSPPFFISSPQNSITGARLAAFRYPVSPPPHSPHHLSPQRDSFRRYSAESESTPEYESETESNAMLKRPISDPASQVPSEDTIWERQGLSSDNEPPKQLIDYASRCECLRLGDEREPAGARACHGYHACVHARRG